MVSFTILTRGVLVTCVAVLGLLANALTLGTLSLRRSRLREVGSVFGRVTSFQVLVVALTVFDTLFLATTLPVQGLETLKLLSQPTFNIIFPTLFPLAMVGFCGSIWTTVALSAERFLASSGRISPGSPRFGAVAAAGVTIWAVVYSLPQFFAYRPGIPDDDWGQVYPVATSLRLDSNWQRWYFLGANYVFSLLIPLVLLIAFNGATVLRLRSVVAEERRATKMLIGIVVIFFLCHFCRFLVVTPSLYRNFFSSVSSPYLDEDSWLDIPFDLSEVTLAVNSAVNVAVYVWADEGFRRVVCPCLCSKRQEDQEINDAGETAVTVKSV